MDSLTFSIVPVAPFRLDVTAWVMRRRAENALDRWDGRTYRRAILFGGVPVDVAVTDQGSVDHPELSVTVSGYRLPEDVQRQAAAALNRMLGLSCNLDEFYRATREDAALAPIVQRFRGLKPTVYPTVFEALVNAIACQQMTLTFGIRLLNRLSEACGRPIGPCEGAPHACPEPEDVLALGLERLRALQFSRAKAHALLDLSAAIIEKRVILEDLAKLDDAAAVTRLTMMRGVGRWTAEYVLLRGLRRLQVFPCDDVGARNNLGRLLGSKEKLNYETARRIVARWHPFAGLVYFHLLIDRLASRDPALIPSPVRTGPRAKLRMLSGPLQRKRRTAMAIRIKRVYEAPARSDGYRVLVDRVWPRGVSRDALALDAWAKDVAPSTGLREWFGHDPAKWREFKACYFRELRENIATVEPMLAAAHRRTVTLLYSAKETQFNNAVALKEFIERRATKQR